MLTVKLGICPQLHCSERGDIAKKRQQPKESCTNCGVTGAEQGSSFQLLSECMQILQLANNCHLGFPRSLREVRGLIKPSAGCCNIGLIIWAMSCTVPAWIRARQHHPLVTELDRIESNRSCVNVSVLVDRWRYDLITPSRIIEEEKVRY